MKKLLLGAGATAALLHSGFALSQVAAAAADAASGPSTATEDLQSVIVTGTRTQGLKAVDSSAPVQVIDSGALRRTGQTDLIQALAQNVPSLTAQAVGGDTANLTLSARLRGLSPNDTLVLVNGKRRHGTANLAVLGGPYQGGAAADLNYIPVASIDHIEVLQDGAAAQYGSDAIAGVVNIILKSNTQGGLISTTGGGYAIDGGGHTGSISGNVGLSPVDGAYINLSAESRYHGFSNRGNIDPRVSGTGLQAQIDNVDSSGVSHPRPIDANIVNGNHYPYVNRISGDAAYHLNIFSMNAGYQVNEALETYSVITYGHKDAEAFENVRMPHVLPSIYPNGFSPEEALTEDDYGVTAGLRGTVFSGWNWDLSTTWGRDDAKINTLNSGNVSLFNDTGSTPTKFYDGMLRASQWTNNLDLSHDFEVGMAKPMTFAVGAEQRNDQYKIVAGDDASRYKEGGQSYPGFQTTDAGSHGRRSYSAYADVALTPISALKLDGALRYEHYSDFGSARIGKLTGRFDFAPTFAVRGTVSNGFRAPTLAEGYYRSTNVGPSSTFAQLAPNSPGASFLGVSGLKPEKSTNFSAGLVLQPVKGLVTTLDAYQITIRDRIVGSGQIYGYNGNLKNPLVSQQVLDAIAANGNAIDPLVLASSNGQVGINIFTNAATTRNRGLDFLTTYPSDYAAYGKVDWTLGANYNQVKVLSTHDVSSSLPASIILDKAAISTLETASPKFRVNAGGLWRISGWSVNLRETLYGPSSDYEFGDDNVYHKNEISTKLITDLEVAKQVTPALSFAVGANNLFNTYPNKKNAELVQSYYNANDNSAVTKYPTYSPFGINGGFYYAKATLTF